MKVYMSVDIEGVAGVVDALQGNVTSGGSDFELGRRLMTEEANAAIEGALAAGATEILVNDSHASMRNLLPELLHPQAKLIQGRLKPEFMVEGLDSSFDAVFFVGYHAAAGVPDGVLNHAYHPYELRGNGQIWSETGINAMMAGYFGVPVALITGDDAAVRDAESILPPHIGVSVKRGITRYAGESLHPSEARTRIRAAAEESLRRLSEWKPVETSTPVTIEMDLYYSFQADVVALMPSVERVGERTIRFQSNNLLDAYHTFVASYYLTRSIPF